MKEDGFLYDIFFSYNLNDEDKVRRICQEFRDAGLRPFFAPVDLSELVGRNGWEEAILKAIPKSYHLGVYCSKDAVISKWVKREITEFRKNFKQRSQKDHRILAITDPDLPQADLKNVLSANEVLKGVLRPRNSQHAMQIVANMRIRQLSAALETAQVELGQTKEAARQSFDYYRHTRFWKPFSAIPDQDLHIFTCGRDTPEETVQRGAGGRTSIDKWDYQAAVDITHYFAGHHRDIGVVIEQPVSKKRIDEQTRSFDTAQFTRELIDRNCIIIGSPDVSDFAEITLARLLDVQPYDPRTRLTTGFRIRKAGRRFSTFYEESSADERDGVRVIREDKSGKFFTCENNQDHGVMVLADNPFSRPGQKHKILILAGHSGVATRAMSLLLTNEEPWCLDTFFDLDQEIAVMGSPLAAVIEVSYKRTHEDGGIGDKRVISTELNSIRVRDVIALKA
jgi:hypothetical protein